MTAPRPAPAAATPTGPAATRRRWLPAIGAVVVLAALVAGWMGFSYLFLRPEAPAAVGLNRPDADRFGRDVVPAVGGTRHHGARGGAV